MQMLLIGFFVAQYIKVRLSPASASVLPPNSTSSVTQKITVTNSLAGQVSLWHICLCIFEKTNVHYFHQKPLLLKIKIDGSIGGVAFSKTAQVSGFPAGF